VIVDAHGYGDLARTIPCRARDRDHVGSRQTLPGKGAMTSTTDGRTLPLKPIEADFEEKLSETIAQLPTVQKLVDEIVAQGLRNVFFVGAGGSLIANYAGFYLLRTRWSSLSSRSRATS
jgi:hypothetical protein